MAIGKNTQAVDRITPKKSGAIRVEFSKPAGDETTLSLSAKGNDDYITKKEFNDNVPSGLPPTPTTITAGVTVNPLVIAYNEATYPSYIIIRASDNSYDFNTNVVYDGVNFTVTGADDGTGHFADSSLFVILPTFGGGGSGGGGLTAANFVEGEVPGGTVNGSNVTFTLANTPTIDTVSVFRNGNRQKETLDYTISGLTITFTTAPLTGNTLLTDYMK